MFIGLLLVIFIIMIIKSQKLVCGVFTHKTASIAFLSFPVLYYIDEFISKYIQAEDSFEVRTDDFIGLFFVCICISGLIGIEKKNPSLIKPALCSLLFVIVAMLAFCIHQVVEEYDFKTGVFSSSAISKQLQSAVIAEYGLLYVGIIILSHYLDLVGEYQLPKSTQTTSKSDPSSKALIIDV